MAYPVTAASRSRRNRARGREAVGSSRAKGEAVRAVRRRDREPQRGPRARRVRPRRARRRHAPRRARALGGQPALERPLRRRQRRRAKIDSLLDWFYPTMSDDGLKREHAHAPLGRASRPRSRRGRRCERDRRRAGERRSRSSSTSTRSTRSASPTGSGASRRPIPRRAATARGSSSSPTGRRIVATAFPTVHQFVVMNECNQPLFVNPQWDASGQNQSAAICGRALAAAYDALKAVDPGELRLGRRPLAARQRQRHGGDATRRPRRCGSSATSARGSRRSRRRRTARRRSWTGSTSTRTRCRSRSRSRRATREPNDASVDQPAADLPGLLRRVPRLAAADDRPADAAAGCPSASTRPASRPRPDGNEYNGTEVSATPAGGVLGQWATQAYQAKWYLADAEPRRVRPERAARQHLPPARRDEPHRLAERALLRRRDTETLRLDGPELDHVHRRRLPDGNYAVETRQQDASPPQSTSPS